MRQDIISRASIGGFGRVSAYFAVISPFRFLMKEASARLKAAVSDATYSTCFASTERWPGVIILNKPETQENAAIARIGQHD